MGGSGLRRRRGMTLVEVLVAFGILALAATVSLQVLSTTRRGHAHSEARNSAAFVARSLLDQARAAPFDTLAGASGAVTLPGVAEGETIQRDFSYSTTVVSQSSDLKRVWVSVTWQGSRDTPPVVVETLVFRH